jgi:hypothetical protein
VSVAKDRYVAFRHHILFDYAASRLYLDPCDSLALRALLACDRSLGLLLAPALGYPLQELWNRSDATRADYWATVADLVADPDADPIARRSPPVRPAS